MVYKTKFLLGFIIIFFNPFTYASGSVDKHTAAQLKKPQQTKNQRRPASQNKKTMNNTGADFTAAFNSKTAGGGDASKSNSQTHKFYGKKTGTELSKAFSENITAENYPEMIESFVFPNAELKDVIKAMSTDLNINIIMSPETANKKISIISYSPITVAEAYQAFLSALSIHGLTVIRSGSFLKIISSESAVKSNSRVYQGNKQLNTDQFLTRIIKPKHIDVADLELKIKPLIDNKSVNSLIFYPPSNMIIITDYSSNVEKIRKIIRTLDVPSQDNIFKVIPIKHAQAERLSQIISNLLSGSSRLSPFYRGRRGSSRSAGLSSKKSGGNIHSLSHDERTNSIIVMGNKAGIKQVETLITQLDYYKDPELAGGIFVYKVKHGLAEELSATLNEVLGQQTSRLNKSGKKGSASVIAQRLGSKFKNTATAQAFEDVRIIAEKNTNSLLIVSNKFNYNTILGILKKVDISRNQVFVKAIIMELSTDRNNHWQIANYFFPKEGKGVARVGYGLNKLTDLASTEGATLMFPLSLLFNNSARKSISGFNNALKNVGQTDINSFVNFGNFRANQGGSIMIPSLSSFVRFLQRTVGGNILSTPQVIALDHQEAKVTIEERIPTVGALTQFGNNSSQFIPNTGKPETVTTQLIITPHINPDVDSVRLKIKQNIDSVVDNASIPAQLRESAIGVKKRSIETSITLKNNETAVIGGLTRASNTNIISKIPILGDLPLLGWLFKNSETEREQSNLIVFITPNIIRSADEHKNILSDKLTERMNFIRQFTGNKDPYQNITEQMLSKKTKTPEASSSLKETIKSQPPAKEIKSEKFEEEDIIEEDIIETDTVEEDSELLNPNDKAPEKELIDPIDADPIDADPGDADPGDADPIDADPIDADPIDADPIDANPGDADPIDADPIDADPGDAE